MGGQIASLRLFCGSVSARADRKSQAVLWLCEWEGRYEVSGCSVALGVGRQIEFSGYSVALSVGGQIGSLRLFCGSVSGRADRNSQAAMWFCECEGKWAVSGRSAVLWFCEWTGRLGISGRWADL